MTIAKVVCRGVGWTTVTSRLHKNPQRRCAKRVASHFDEWVRVQDLPPGDDRSVMFLQRLERTTFLREDAQEGFLRVLVELAVTHCLGSEKKNQGGEESSMSFAAVDAYCRLVTRLVRRPEESLQQRLALFGRALVAIVRTAMRDTDERGPQFNPKPYFRALSGLLNEIALRMRC